MSATVVSLSDIRRHFNRHRWSNQDVAEIYRVSDILCRSGLSVELENGHTDEGDQWYAFCNSSTGDVIVHIALIDDRYVADVCHLGVRFTGNSLSEIIDQFLNAYPVILPGNSGSKVTRVWMHPASGLAALVATLYFLLEMSSPAEAAEASEQFTLDGGILLDNEAGEPLPTTYVSSDLNAERKPLQRVFVRDEAGSGQEGVRLIAVTAAAMLAGLYVDSDWTVDDLVSFEPHSILEQIGGGVSEELATEVIRALKMIAEGSAGLIDGKDGTAETGGLRTSHLVKGNREAEAKTAEDGLGIGELGEDGQLVIDVDGSLGEADRPFGLDRADGVDAFAMLEAESSEDDARVDKEVRENVQVNTIAASTPSDVVESEGIENAVETDDVPALGEAEVAASEEIDVVTAAFSDSGSSSNSNSGSNSGSGTASDLLGALGLTILTSSEVETEFVQVLAQLTTVPAPDNFEADPVVFETAPVETPLDPVSTGVLSESEASDQLAETASFDLVELGLGTETEGENSAGPSSNSGAEDQSAAAPLSQPDPEPEESPIEILVGEAPAFGASLINELPADYDLSILDPIAVLQLFVQSVEDVAYVSIDLEFYLYDTLAVSSQPELLEIEVVELTGGDEVNLVGQAETFEAIFQALA